MSTKRSLWLLTPSRDLSDNDRASYAFISKQLTIKPSLVLAVLFAAPISVLAGSYKCTGSDGKVSFQDQPCEAGTTGNQIVIKTIPPASDAKPMNRRIKQDFQWEGVREETKARNEQIEAYNRAVSCSNARRRLGILKEQRPVFQYNNKGERVYLDDSTRNSELAAAERGVADYCN